MRRYHHLGIPCAEPRPGERYLAAFKTYIVSHRQSEFGLEWLRFEADAPVPELVRTTPHIAFEVEYLTSELAGRDILIPPNSPSPGVRVAFILESGMPIELIEFTDKDHPDRRRDRS